MAKRRPNAADFDDWDLLDDFPEEKTKPKPSYVPNSQDEDWAEYTEEERKARGYKKRNNSRGSRNGKKTGRGAKKGTAGIAIAAAAVLLLIFIGKPDAGGKIDTPDQPVLNTTPWLPDVVAPDVTLPEATLPEVVEPAPTEPATMPPWTEPVFETEPPYTETFPQETESQYVEPREYRYYGSQLNDMEKRAYDILEKAFFAQQERVEGIQLLSVESLFQVADAVIRDYAELYWYSGLYNYWTEERDGYLEFALEPIYDYTPAERMQMQALVEDRTRDKLAELYWKSDYEKVKGVYEFLIDYSAYDYAYMGETLYELFRDGRAVCAAYARATQYMLTQLGIETIYITGEGGTFEHRESHAWNIVKVGGEYYQLDTTWGDPYYEDGTQTKNFVYLCLTDEEMNRNHWADRQGYPPCTSTTYNYYNYEGKFLYYYDREQIKQWMIESELTGEPMTFKMANAQLYQEVKYRLFDNDEVFTLMEEALNYQVGCISYPDDLFYIMSITW